MPKRPDDLDLYRIVLDTNTWVSGTFFAESFPGQAIEKARRGGLGKRSDLGRTGRSADAVEVRSVRLTCEAACVLRDIVDASSLIEVDFHVDACPDPKDNKFLSLALAGNARVLITGDKDLLILGSFGGTRILTAKEYLGDT